MYNRKSLKKPASLKGQALLGSLARFTARFSHPPCSPFLGVFVHLNKNIAYSEECVRHMEQAQLLASGRNQVLKLAGERVFYVTFETVLFA